MVSLRATRSFYPSVRVYRPPGQPCSGRQPTYGQITYGDVAEYLAEHPGSRAGEIAKGLGVSLARVSSHLYRGKHTRFVSREDGWHLAKAGTTPPGPAGAGRARGGKDEPALAWTPQGVGRGTQPKRHGWPWGGRMGFASGASRTPSAARFPGVWLLIRVTWCCWGGWRSSTAHESISLGPCWVRSALGAACRSPAASGGLVQPACCSSASRRGSRPPQRVLRATGSRFEVWHPQIGVLAARRGGERCAPAYRRRAPRSASGFQSALRGTAGRGNTCGRRGPHRWAAGGGRGRADREV